MFKQDDSPNKATAGYEPLGNFEVVCFPWAEFFEILGGWGTVSPRRGT